MLKPIAAALLALSAPTAFAQSAPETAQAPAAAFALAPLPYAYDALLPVIDAETMQLHHGKHHQAYVDNLNKAVAANPALKGLTLEQLLARTSTLTQAGRDNAGGHWNHQFFWKLMAPEGQRGEPSKELRQAIEKQWGTLDAFKEAFQKAGTSRFGSGWAWLIVTPDGTLKVVSTPNQDNPLMDIAADKGTPVLANDVWEHAYYISYRNRRAEYLSKWWNIVNWNQVNSHFKAATKR